MRRIGLTVAGFGVFVAVTASSTTAQAATYWRAGVRSSSPSVCFVGDALASRPDRVAQVIDQLEHFEHAANIRFDVWGECPAPTKLPNGNDHFDGDIRVVLRYTSGTKVSSWTGEGGTGPIPGEGCPSYMSGGNYNGKNNGWGSWSNAPSSLSSKRSCMYNLKLGDDPWNDEPYLNHLLHEFGHAMGLAHEHVRSDADTKACPDLGSPSHKSGHMTPYDRDSVMHYRYSNCGIDGNYGRSGFSRYDQLALHILYPEKRGVAEVDGATVVRTGEPISLASRWHRQGAKIGYVAGAFQWKIDGQNRSSQHWINAQLSTGKHTLSVQHTDLIGRSYKWTTELLVLTPSAYAARVAALTR